MTVYRTTAEWVNDDLVVRSDVIETLMSLEITEFTFVGITAPQEVCEAYAREVALRERKQARQES